MKFILSFLIIVLFFSCGAGLSKEEKNKKNIENKIMEVMEVHDSVMPKTGNIFKLKKKLSSIEKALNDSIQLKEIYSVKQELVAADDAMMQWMHEFKEADPYMEFEEKMKYYDNEKNKIIRIRNLIHESILRAEKTIDKYELDTLR
jgi:predicted  nucleic acid-binding Zn-ribbon protein